MNLPQPAPGNINCYCGLLNTPGCTTCNNCNLHCGCRCRQCRNCGRKHAWGMCRVCGQCKRPSLVKAGKAVYDGAYRCTCHTRPKAHKLLPSHSVKGFRSTRLRRPIGLEIELSVPGDTERRLTTPVHYQWVHDGSITPGGMEMVVLPLVGDKLVEGITYLSALFARNGAQVDNTCGYHVHVGAGEWGPYELRRLLILYRRFEDVFYDLVEDGRDKTRLVRGEAKCYCKRLAWPGKWYQTLTTITRPRDILKYLISALYPDWVRGTTRVNMRDIRRHKYEACRYYGLNLHTWFERGTVEYRHHEGTINRDKLLNWALWCGWFTEFASCLSDAQVAACTSLELLLFSEWPTGAGVLRMPSDVAAYVLATRAERLKERKAEVKF